MSKSDLDHSMRGTAALAACIVQTLSESDPSYHERFLRRLAAAYVVFRDDTDGDVAQEIQLLSWVRSDLTGFDFVQGQGAPFLSNYKP